MAGGFGTRLAEETVLKPKPMIEIGGKPILWHILKIYSAHGINEFIICLGYKGYMIKEYFINYIYHASDLQVDIGTNTVKTLDNGAEHWKISLIDTGDNSMTGGRLGRISKFVGSEDFCMTYGDGVGDIDISALIRFHKTHGKMATVTSVTPPGRFGAMKIEGDLVTAFQEKPSGDGGLINGGYFVLSPKCLDLIEGDHTVWEQEPMMKLAEMGELKTYRHNGYWQPMDTLREKNHLEELWKTGKAQWKQW